MIASQTRSNSHQSHTNQPLCTRRTQQHGAGHLSLKNFCRKYLLQQPSRQSLSVETHCRLHRNSTPWSKKPAQHDLVHGMERAAGTGFSFCVGRDSSCPSMVGLEKSLVLFWTLFPSLLHMPVLFYAYCTYYIVYVRKSIFVLSGHIFQK
jgi:hypothetical protein